MVNSYFELNVVRLHVDEQVDRVSNDERIRFRSLVEAEHEMLRVSKNPYEFEQEEIFCFIIREIPFGVLCINGDDDCLTERVYLPDGTTKEIGSGAYDFSCDIPTSHPAILKDEFLYERTFFPEAHASTIVETKKGDLVAAYFGGTHEKDPDVCIYVNIKKKGSDTWSTPILAADGVLDLNDPRAKLAGLSGMKDDTTPATNGSSSPEKSARPPPIPKLNSPLFTIIMQIQAGSTGQCSSGRDSLTSLTTTVRAVLHR